MFFLVEISEEFSEETPGFPYTGRLGTHLTICLACLATMTSFHVYYLEPLLSLESVGYSVIHFLYGSLSGGMIYILAVWTYHFFMSPFMKPGSELIKTVTFFLACKLTGSTLKYSGSLEASELERMWKSMMISSSIHESEHHIITTSL